MGVSGTNDATQNVPFGTDVGAVPLTGTTSNGSSGTPARSDHSHGFSPPACRVFHNANQNIVHNNSSTNVIFNSKSFDNDGMHDTSTNSDRITFNKAGVYVVTFTGLLQSAADYTRYFARILNNAGTELARQTSFGALSSGDSPAVTVTTTAKFAANDYVITRVTQTNTAVADRLLLANFAIFSAAWVSPG